MHFIFDFAEKIFFLVYRTRKQPGQLHFITGFKFDSFGLSCINTGRSDIYGLVEGHWPPGKTVNTVLSMLHHCIECYRTYTSSQSKNKSMLHADNCSGKKTLWDFLFSRAVMLGLEQEVTLHFLIAGHTMNVCDGAFGHVKRDLRSADVVVPKDTIALISNSAVSN